MCSLRLVVSRSNQKIETKHQQALSLLYSQVSDKLAEIYRKLSYFFVYFQVDRVTLLTAI